MSATLSQHKQENKLVQRVATLEDTIFEMRSNQAQKLSFAGLTLDGTGTTGTLGGSVPILSADGLASATNFPLNDVFSAVEQTTTSASLVDVPGSTLNPFSTAAAHTSVLITIVAWAYNTSFPVDGSAVQVDCIDSVDGSVIGFEAYGITYLSGIDFVGQSWSVSIFPQAVTVPAVIQLSPGSHTLSLRYGVIGGGTAHMVDFYLGYIILGASL